MKKKYNRRDFIKNTSSASLATILSSITAGSFLSSCSQKNKMPSTADSVILLWMGGGMAHTETFDPKEYAPYVKGMDANKMLSTFPKIPTSLDGVFISEGLENIAQTLHKGTLIRSYKAADIGEILHSRHQYLWHTSYVPPQSIEVPHIGAWISKEKGKKVDSMPAFVSLGQRFDLGEGDELKSFHTAGFLGAEYGPIIIPEPGKGLDTLSLKGSMNFSRFESRNKRYRELIEKSELGKHASDYQMQSFMNSLENSYKLLKSPSAKAFDLSQLKSDEIKRYDTGTQFGLGCLMAKNLVKGGARFVSVSSQYAPFKGWDTHEKGHERVVGMKKMIDRPVANLINDLDQEGLLENTMVILASEFSRDSLIEGSNEKKLKNGVKAPEVVNDKKFYGLHRHFVDGCSVMMWGGGLKKGYVHGATADEKPCSIIKDKIEIEQLHQTIYHAFGIPNDTHYTIESRPVYTTPDGTARPELNLLA